MDGASLCPSFVVHFDSVIEVISNRNETNCRTLEIWDTKYNDVVIYQGPIPNAGLANLFQ